MSPFEGYYFSDTYVCWVNHFDSIYTVYLKKISPFQGENIIVARDSTVKSNPQFNYSRIVWQNYTHGNWQIVSRDFSNDTLGSETVLADSLINDPQITLGIYRVAWIEDGKIIGKELFGEFNEEIIDSTNCSSADLSNDEQQRYSRIIYEKGLANAKEIYIADLNTSKSPAWTINKISDYSNCLNPRFGFFNESAFQIFQDSSWKVLYENIAKNAAFDNIHILNCDLKNPLIFTYGIVTSNSDIHTPFFVVFEKYIRADDQSDIYLKTMNFGDSDSLINVSNIAGKNYQPQIGYMNISDTAKIAIFWIHEEEGNKELWIAESIFNPVIGDIDVDPKIETVFHLKNNYPNPFNSDTHIEYSLFKAGFVSIIVYNVLGEAVDIVEKGFKNAGDHKTRFSAENLPSGIYYYTLRFAEVSQTKSMMLIK